MSLGIWQILIIAVVVLLLFGRGRIADVMGDFGKGIKSFKQGLAEDDKPEPPKQIEHDRAAGKAAARSESSEKSAD